VGGAVTKYVYFGDRLLDETDDAGTLVSRYSTMGPSYFDQWVASYNSGIAWFPATDGVGTTRQWLTSTKLVPRLAKKIALFAGIAVDALRNMVKHGPLVMDYLRSGGGGSALPCD
jgi:hypothetical protein